MRIYGYRYFNLQPHRDEARIELSDRHRVRFITTTSDSEFHGSWRRDENHFLRLNFHYCGDDADIIRHLVMWNPANTEILISRQSRPYPVVMLYADTREVEAPRPRAPPTLGHSRDPDGDHSDVDRVFEQMLMWEFNIPYYCQGTEFLSYQRW